MLPPDPEAPPSPQKEGLDSTVEGATVDSDASRSINDGGDVDSSEGMFARMFETAVGMAGEAAEEQLELQQLASTTAMTEEQSEQDGEESADHREGPETDVRDNGDDADSDSDGSGDE